MADLKERASPPKQLAINSDGVVAPPYMTYQEFLDWLDEETLAEWVDGEVEMTSPASFKHQMLNSFLYSVVQGFVQLHSLGVVVQPPFQMKLPAGGPGREPDLIFVASHHLQRFEEVYLSGPADLVVEVVSKESNTRDNKTKFLEYARGGIPEYWLVNPLKKRATFYQLAANNVYDEIALDGEGKYHSKILPDFWLREAWLWQNPLPQITDVLLEIDQPNYTRHLLEKLKMYQTPNS